MIEIRHLRYGEEVPEDLHIGYRSEDLSPGLTWVAVLDGKIIGVLLAYGGHRTLMLIRVAGRVGNPPIWLYKLLKGAITEARGRGYNGVVVALEEDSAGKRLHRALKRSGWWYRKETMHWFANNMQAILHEKEPVSVPIEPGVRVVNG